MAKENSNHAGLPATKTQPRKRLEQLMAAIPEGSVIERYTQHAHTLELFIKWDEPALGERRCPSCGSSRCIKKDGGTQQTVRHILTGTFGTLITFHKPRLLCKDCGKSFFVKPGWVVNHMSVTSHVLLDIASRLTSTPQCVEQIAKDTNTSASIVLNVMQHIKLDKPKSLPETIGIDEFHGSTGTYNPKTKRFDTEKYHCVITDPGQGCVLDILYKATYHELHHYFMEYPLFIRQNVKFFCADMRNGFSSVARACFPNARICIDPFHVIKLLIDAVDTIRIDLWHSLVRKAAELDALASAAMDDGNDTLKDIFSVGSDLETAREALEDFYSIVEITAYAFRRAELTTWINKYKSCELPPIRQAACTIMKCRQGIENAWKFNKSNGPTEGLNKKIKDVRRMINTSMSPFQTRRAFTASLALWQRK